MSRKVSQYAAQAVQNLCNYSNGKNTRVVDGNLYLHGNHIARPAGEGYVAISNRGWFTLTTKDRLNALSGVGISQRRGKWYLNGREWDGGWVIVNHSTGEWSPELDF